MSSLSPPSHILKKYDRGRFLAHLFLPASVRDDVATLWAFSEEIAHIRERTEEPMLRLIRLQWWREAIERSYQGNSTRHELAEPLHNVIHRHALPETAFYTILDAEDHLLSEGLKDMDDFQRYAEHYDGTLLMLTAKILGQEIAGNIRQPYAYACGIERLLRALPKENCLPADVAEQEGAITHIATHGIGYATQTLMTARASEKRLLISLISLKERLKYYQKHRYLRASQPISPKIVVTMWLYSIS